jgi:DNA processing protein
MTELVELVALSLLPPGRWRAATERLRRGEAAGSVLEQLAANLQAPSTADRLRADARGLRRRAARACERGAALELTPIAWCDARYPASLAAIADPPFVLWTRGELAALDRPAVALVGSRAASAYGLAVAARLAGDLASHGLAIVSGLARGIDSAAHGGALSAGGRTVAVLGSGADVIYPPEHAALASAIARDGLVVSELVPGTRPLAHFFPLRNRIISGLARAVVVVEAGEKSGSLITARLALEQGRDVLAVPGNVLSGRNRGAHGLLRDGAKIVEAVDDILEELGYPHGTGRHASGSCADPVLACFSPGEPADLDALADRSGLTSARLLTRLLELELQGFVARAGGGRFVRVDRTC